jgi:hypothetical protein
MPPLFCLYLAGLLKLLHSKTLVALVVAITANVTWAFVGTVTCLVARIHCRRVPTIFVMLFYLLWLGVFYASYFMLAHDIWFVALLVTLTLCQVSSYVHKGTFSRVRWGVTGGIAALMSPAFAFAWGVLTLWLFFGDKERRKMIAVSMGVGLLIAAPWIIRNAVVFHQFIPSKSNLGYDAFQANNLDDDGVYDEWSFQHHPYNSIRAMQEHVRLGEKQFIAKHARAFLNSLHRNPTNFTTRVAHRFAAITFNYPAIDQYDAIGFRRILQKLLYPLPLLSVLLSFRRGSSHQLLFAMLRVLACAYIVPYTFVAFYVRHLFPLTAVLILMLFLSLDSAMAVASERNWGRRLIRALQRQ